MNELQRIDKKIAISGWPTQAAFGLSGEYKAGGPLKARFRLDWVKTRAILLRKADLHATY
jgi:hypothetical protein